MKEIQNYNLDVKNMAKVFDLDIDDIPKESVDIINKFDFRYRTLSKKENDSFLIKLFNKIFSKSQSVSGEDQKHKWDKGWGDILEKFISKNYDKKYLIPQYNDHEDFIHVMGEYVKPVDNNFENNFISVLRSVICHKYLKDIDNVYEFGCGTGHNLVDFYETFPNKSFYGSDWSEKSKHIIYYINENLGYNIEFFVFDMFNPDLNIKIKENSVAFTMGSLEQLGGNFDKFLNFLLDSPFSLYIHVNSILEYYDIDNDITDYCIYQFEKKRNYLCGYFPKLKELHKEGVIEILKMSRVACGGRYGDGYSITVWKKNDNISK